jgi:hypothetical protein
MAWWSGRVVVAFDASSVQGAVLAPGFGRVEARVVERIPLGPETLVPSPTEPNLARRDAIGAGLRELLEKLGRPPKATLVLPLGVARLMALDPPPGTEPREYARFRLGPTLGFPAAEAIVDVLGVGSRVVAAAVRRGVVTDYETLAAECGLGLERVDLMPLPALEGRRREAAGARLDVFLGDAAFAVALRQAGELIAFHTRWRSPGDGGDRIARLVERLARQAGAVGPRVIVLGEGGGAVAEALRLRGQAAEPGPEHALLGVAA